MSQVNLEEIRQKLATTQGSDYWRSLDELAETEEFKDYIRHEFPKEADFWNEPISRRRFLQLMGAGFSLAFFTGCRKPLEKILPYNQQPEDLIPGKPLFYASTLPYGGYGRGVLVENHMGRPTKVEGNPAHPDSLGSTDVFMQASVLSLYDPDRSQVVLGQGGIRTWEEFLGALQKGLSDQQAKKGAGLRILTETITSPALGQQLRDILKQFPKARWHQYEPVTRDSLREGSRLAFGEVVETHYRFGEADVILSLDSDFLIELPGSLRYAREFAKRRQPGVVNTLNRLYAVEPMPTVTGSMADHRLPLTSSQVETFARELARAIGLNAKSASSTLPDQSARWLGALVKDLKRHRGSSLIIAGVSQPPIVHALAHAMNEALGNVGRTIFYTDSVESEPVAQVGPLRELVQEMKAGQVDWLFILGGNPVYNAPADLDFAGALAKVKNSIHLSLYEDETSAQCQWHIPEAHPLESWGDLRGSDGTASLVQPLIEPLYGGKTSYEILSAIVDASPRRSFDVVHDYWKSRSHALDFEWAWQKSLNDGVVAGTALPQIHPSLRANFDQASPSSPQSGGLEIVFKPDPSLWDGRWANNAWLQELPKPMTKLTWDNAAHLSPRLAQKLGLSNGDVVVLRFEGRSVDAPIWIVPGHADDAVTVTLGYGRDRAGHVGNKTGFNAYTLRSSQSLWRAQGLSVRRTGKTYRLASTQHHFSMEGRDLLRVGTLGEYERNPHFAQEKKESKETLYNYDKPAKSEEYAWGMGIDLTMCIGCNACVIACQAENNIPTVGKDQVLTGREMHWLRVDRYFKGDLDNPESYNQPVPCMHCEDAPCEVVCPVGATVHSEEGLNEMIYNRCVGTRYCSNNCPYKVRRFNFLEYTKGITGPLKLLQNPDVTVRARGVMEKCTYCVQRIQSAKITADKEGRAVLDGEIVPACAQACPTQTITFGNLLDKKSRVSQVKADPRDYGLLAELGTRPRTTYQARLRNPNPEIVES